MSGWGTGAYDFDNDGHKDLFIANGHVSENIELYGHHRYRQPNAVFQGWSERPLPRRDLSGGGGHAARPGPPGVRLRRPRRRRPRRRRRVASIGEPAEVLYNVTEGAGHWLGLRLQGTKSNRDGLGATVKLTGESGRVQYNHATTAVGYASSSDKRVHFGLGADRAAREIEIRWPSGRGRF